MSKQKHKVGSETRVLDKKMFSYKLESSKPARYVIYLILMFVVGFSFGFLARQCVLEITGHAFVGEVGGGCHMPNTGEDWEISTNCNITDETINNISTGYNINITNGARVYFDNCNISMNSTDSDTDGIIYVEDGATLIINNSDVYSGNANAFPIKILASAGGFESYDSTYDDIAYISALKPVTFDHSDITLIGEYAAVGLYTGSSGSVIQHTSVTSGTYFGFLVCSAHDITFDNVTVDGPGATIYTDSDWDETCTGEVYNILINNSDLKSNDSIVVELHAQPEDVTIMNSHIEKTEADGCEPGGGDPFNEDELAGDCPDKDSLIKCYGSGVMDRCEDLRIENNTLKSSGSTWDNGTSVYVYYGDNVIVKDNNINASKKAGVHFVYTTDSLIQGNNINKTLSYTGILLQYSDNNDIIDNEITGDQTRDCHSSLKAIQLLSSSDNNLFVGNTVITEATGIDFGRNCVNNTFANGTIDSECVGTVFEAIVSNTSQVSGRGYLVNTTLAHDAINASGTGRIYRQWYLDVYVDDGSDPLEGATVDIYNNTDDLVYTDETDASGFVYNKVVTERVVTSSGDLSMSNYTINANKECCEGDSAELNMTDIADNTQVDLGLVVNHSITVELVSPWNENVINESFVDFTFNVTSWIEINNCGVYISRDWGVTYELNTTSTNINHTEGTTNTIMVYMVESEEPYFWKINCTSDYNSTYSEERSVTITGREEEPDPVVSLISPDDGDTSSSFDVTFTYSVAADPNIENCSLIIDGSVEEFDDSITKNVEQTFSHTFDANGDYTWSINCTDDYEPSNTGSSSQRDITIDVTGCGNGSCDAGEDCDSCEADCGECVCGDGECNGDETCRTCEEDCDDCSGPSPGGAPPAGTVYYASLNITLPEVLLVFPKLLEKDKVVLEVMFADFSKKNYSIKVEKIVTNSYVNFSINSGAHIQLYKTWMKKIDLNGDGKNDIFLQLSNMPQGTKANLTIGNIVVYPAGVTPPSKDKIVEIVIESGTPYYGGDNVSLNVSGNQTGQGGEQPKFVFNIKYVYITVFGVLIVAALILFMYKKKGKLRFLKAKKQSEGFSSDRGVLDLDKVKEQLVKEALKDPSKEIQIKAPSSPEKKVSESLWAPAEAPAKKVSKKK